MVASIRPSCSSMRGHNASHPNFLSWLADQIARSDEIGHLSRLAFLNGAIDRSDRELVHKAHCRMGVGLGSQVFAPSALDRC